MKRITVEMMCGCRFVYTTSAPVDIEKIKTALMRHDRLACYCPGHDKISWPVFETISVEDGEQ